MIAHYLDRSSFPLSHLGDRLKDPARPQCADGRELYVASEIRRDVCEQRRQRRQQLLEEQRQPEFLIRNRSLPIQACWATELSAGQEQAWWEWSPKDSGPRSLELRAESEPEAETWTARESVLPKSGGS